MDDRTSKKRKHPSDTKHSTQSFKSGGGGDNDKHKHHHHHRHSHHHHHHHRGTNDNQNDAELEQRRQELQLQKRQLASQRSKLPVYRYKKEICDLVEQKEVLLYVCYSLVVCYNVSCAAAAVRLVVYLVGA